LLNAFGDEFTEAFGGATVMRGFEGRYETDGGEKIVEKMNVVYADVPLALAEFSTEIDQYLTALKQAAHEILAEESILVTARPIFHAE
jgi:hypothetical protein